MIGGGLNAPDRASGGVGGTPSSAGALEEIEKSKLVGCLMQGCLVTLLFSMLIVFLLLFLPLGERARKPRVAPPPAVSAIAKGGLGRIGAAQYKPLWAKRTGPGDPFSKAAIVTLRFTVTNLAPVSRVLDESMINLVDDGDRSYPVSRELSDRRYAAQQKAIPWGESIEPGYTKTIDAVFVVERAATKFSLEARDLDWRSTETVRLVIADLKPE